MSCFIYPVDNSKRSDSGLFHLLDYLVVNWEIISYLLPGAVSQCGPLFHCPGMSLEFVNLPLKAASVEKATVSHPESPCGLSPEYSPYKGSLFLLWLPLSFLDRKGGCVGSLLHLGLLSPMNTQKLCYLWMSGPLLRTDGDFMGQMTCLKLYCKAIIKSLGILG